MYFSCVIPQNLTNPLCMIASGTVLLISILWRSSFTAGEGAAMARQTGQLECEWSHMSIHGTWKECKHSGIVFNSSPSSKSPKHTAHAVVVSPSSSSETTSTLFLLWYLCVGIRCTIDEEALSPRLKVAENRGGCGGLWSAVVLWWRENQMLMTRYIETTTNAAEQRAISMTITFWYKGWSPSAINQRSCQTRKKKKKSQIYRLYQRWQCRPKRTKFILNILFVPLIINVFAPFSWFGNNRNKNVTLLLIS